MVSLPPAPSTVFTTASSFTSIVSLVTHPKAEVPVLEPPVVLEPPLRQLTKVLRKNQSLLSLGSPPAFPS